MACTQSQSACWAKLGSAYASPREELITNSGCWRSWASVTAVVRAARPGAVALKPTTMVMGSPSGTTGMTGMLDDWGSLMSAACEVASG